MKIVVNPCKYEPDLASACISARTGFARVEVGLALFAGELIQTSTLEVVDQVHASATVHTWLGVTLVHVYVTVGA